MLCYIGLGSNLELPLERAIAARGALHANPSLELISVSSLYQSRPMGPQDQPDYLNAVIALETQLSALELLDVCQSIEQDQGRVRKQQRWGPRSLDLDILLYGQTSINNERLTIPHYGMHEREFVLLPLMEIAADLILPNGEQVCDLAQNIARNGLVKYLHPEQWLPA
ncbi:2-amino-4-hydroxy-6-hydroxymethyldihydropteridine diphosphokinase [Alginatibacterium sediminis]|uniref:2-amino-4-hydroxy-6-hydroxymethyldihydropteridine pyrophosphokinase n=1 Tax=Alginatibacterium sediminis TaxID=2164068 RepID=A0A420E8U6_9ALTE|nr:2-amino-4-hydroxy-6-hydroxymethyldihydropteridine diphosphokinase [Alginatibacterium sediminis]RKF15855.1 2-amino-4-hydroxy-6-hydroxymethyldihydropteridine diphosphokinase [Alginatibacterium sediminis]